MSVELTDREHQIIQQLILDRWNPHRINKKIADHHGLTINQVKYMRSKPAFKAEYDKQLAIYLDSFDDIQLADRKERVKAMAGLYEKIPNIRVAFDVTVCPDCGGHMRIVAALTNLASIRSYLEGVGLPARPPPISLARHSQQSEFEYAAL
mgnify:CR=1 FL=1